MIKLESGNKTIFLIILASFMVIYLDFALLMKLQLTGIKTLGPNISKLKKDLAALERDLTSIQDLKNKQIEGKENAPPGAKKIISDEYTASLLQEVSTLANNNEVRIVQMKPAKEPQGAKFTPLSITLDLVCDYHRLGKFINDLENAEIFIAVQNIKIAPQPADILKQKVNLVLMTYVKK